MERKQALWARIISSGVSTCSDKDSVVILEALAHLAQYPATALFISVNYNHVMHVSILAGAFSSQLSSKSL